MPEHDEDMEEDAELKQRKLKFSAGIFDLFAITVGTILWLFDILSDIYVARKAYTEYGTYWGITLSALLISSIIVTYCLHICTVPGTAFYDFAIELEEDFQTYCDAIGLRLRKNPVLLLGPLGR